MIQVAPMPFHEALDSREVRSLLPTSGRTRDFATLDSAIKQRAMFSATVTSAKLLQKYNDVIDGILAGHLDQASARLAIKGVLEEMGYVPDPEHVGGLQDLSSNRRIDTTLETNVDVARGYGWREQGMQPDVLDEYPAQELFRAFGPKDVSKQRDWAARWREVGGEFYGERMIALKTDPIWSRLGDPKNFPDALGNPWPPFAFNSGMDVQDVGRDEAIALGLLTENTELLPQPTDFNADLKATPDIRSDWLRQMLEDTGLGSFDAAGVFHFEEAD